MFITNMKPLHSGIISIPASPKTWTWKLSPPLASQITGKSEKCPQSRPQEGPKCTLKSITIDIYASVCPLGAPLGPRITKIVPQIPKMKPQSSKITVFDLKSYPFQQSTGQQLPSDRGAGGRGEALIYIYIYIYTYISLYIYIYMCAYIGVCNTISSFTIAYHIISSWVGAGSHLIRHEAFGHNWMWICPLCDYMLYPIGKGGGGVWNHLQNKKLPVAVRKQLPDDIPLCLQGVKRKVLLVLRHDHLCKNSHGSSLGMSDLFVLWGK
jgi:hypothetical protein